MHVSNYNQTVNTSYNNLYTMIIFLIDHTYMTDNLPKSQKQSLNY